MTHPISPDKNIHDVDATLHSLMCRVLDLDSQWRRLVECADGTCFQLTISEVEECGRVIQRSLNASPTETLFRKWSMAGMTVGCLTKFLDELRIERLLIYILPQKILHILTQPVSELTIEEGDQLELFCEASGFPYPIYVWFCGERLISKNQNGRLVIDRASKSNSGKYTCRIHHEYNSKLHHIFTDWSDVTVKPRKTSVIPNNQFKCDKNSKDNFVKLPQKLHLPQTNVWIPPFIPMDSHNKEMPTILREPTDQTNSLGGHTMFVVEASHPNEQLLYQWYHKNKPIQDATLNVFEFEIVGLENAGEYQVRVFTSHNSPGVLSRNALLTVKTNPNTYKAGDKVALIIGISTYRSYGQPLPAVENDLYSTVKVFTEMNFKVISLLDLTLIEMMNAVDLFCDLLSTDVYAVFYCAGHGFTFNKEHYLIPWDAHQGNNLQESLCIETVEAKIQKKNPKVLMMFLDICRTSAQLSDHHTIIPQTPILDRPTKANKITIYAASIGEQSFEESKRSSKDPRGIFNQYLLEVLEKKDLNAFQVFQSLQTKFTSSPYDRNKFPQHPEMTINLQESERSLWDPIDDRSYKQIIYMRNLQWESLHVLPQSINVKIDEFGFINLRFEKVASNVMFMIAVPHLNCSNNWQSIISLPKEMIDPVLQPIKTTRKPPDMTFFRFPNLQRLQSKLTVRLEIQLYTNKSEMPVQKRFCMIDLGLPMVAGCNLGEIRQHDLQYNVSNTMQNGERREPMEHAEETLSLTDQQN